jgi:hypothetical protein
MQNVYNPKTKIIASAGIDIPFLHVYLAGRIAGECIEECLEWRHKIVDHYRNYKGKGAYPIVFLDALNSKEADSIDKKGLTSAIPPNLIYDKDLLSVETADVIVANMEDFFEAGIEEELDLVNARVKDFPDSIATAGIYKAAYLKLREKIMNRRENLGTISEMAWGLYLKKPLILIVPQRRRETFEKHPFTKRASVIVGSVEELLEKKWLQIIYKSIAGATY